MSDEIREERIVREGPGVVRHEVVRTRDSGGAAGWWVAAFVAVIAIVGLVFWMNSQPGDAQLQAAQDQGRAQAALDSATAQAQAAASSAATASANAADSMARSTQAAADSARAAADHTARAAQDAASNASDTVSEPAPQNPQ